MNINDFCVACESSHEPTKIFYHGTSLLTQEIINMKKLSPTSIDLGNFFQKPGRSIFMWKTEKEALIWAIGDLLFVFNEWLDDISEKGGIDTSSMYCKKFTPDNILIDTDNFRFHSWWDRVRNCWIIPNKEKDNFNRAVTYFDKYNLYTYVLKLETRAKYVSIGQTATLREYTTRDPETKVVDIIPYRVTKKEIKIAYDIVPDSYFNEDYAI